MKDDDYHYHECVCRRKRSTRIMWAKRPLVPNTPTSAIIHITSQYNLLLQQEFTNLRADYVMRWS